jgi:hypothetical protein
MWRISRRAEIAVWHYAAGNYHSLALKKDGTLWSCGNNSVGQLGIGNNINTSIPTQITAPSNARFYAIATGFGGHCLALQYDSKLLAWGFNSDGQLGIRSNINQFSPVAVKFNSWSLNNQGLSDLTPVLFNSPVTAAPGQFIGSQIYRYRWYNKNVNLRPDIFILIIMQTDSQEADN